MVRESTKKYLFNALKIFFFLLSILLFYYLLRTIGFDKIVLSFKNIGLLGALALVFMGFLENILDSASLRYATPQKIPLWKVHAINSVGGLMNTFFPWDMGEVVKGGLIKKDASLKDSVVGVAHYNLVFKLSKPLAILLTIMLALLMKVESDMYMIVLLLGASLLSFLPFLFILLVFRFSLTTKLSRFLSRFFKRDFSTFLLKVNDLEHSLDLSRKNKRGDFYKVLSLQFVARIISLLTFLAVAYLSGEVRYTFAILCIANAYINLMNYITMLIPAKLGVTEGTAYIVFSMLGLDGGVGVLIALILRVKALLTMAFSSLLLMFM